MRLLPLYLLVLYLFSASGHAALKTTEHAYSWDGRIFRLPLTVSDNSGVRRDRWPVTTGLPLPPSVVDDVSQLRLLDTAGNEIPCQFTPLSHYAARDNSLRWVLLDFQLDLAAHGETQVILANDRPARATKDGISVTETPTAITVNTGVLEASISRTTGNLIERVLVNGTPVLQARAGDGPYIVSGKVESFDHFEGTSWNTHGWKKTRSTMQHAVTEARYKGGAPDEVEVESAGPMHAVILLRGNHEAPGRGEGVIASGLYNYSVRLHFYHGHSFIKVEYSIENSATSQPQWNYLFREAGLVHHLLLESPAVLVGGGDVAVPTVTTAGRLPSKGDDSVWLYQPAARTEGRGKKRVAREAEYRVIRAAGHGSGETAGVGKRPRYVAVSDGSRGLSVSIRYFWEQAPRAIQVENGSIRVMAHAGNPPGKQVMEASPEYDLDFGERTINDFLYYFFTGESGHARLHEVAEAFEYPLFARAPPAWYSDTETWYFEIGREPAATDVSQDEHWVTGMAGYRDHGNSHGYNSGGHHESLNSGWLGFLRSGSLAELEHMLVKSRWHISHNPGWNYRDNRLVHGAADRKYSVLDSALEHWNTLAGFGPKDFYLWRDGKTARERKSGEGKDKRGGGQTYLNKYKWLPDHEHYALFTLFEYYYLTGDRRALDSIHGFVNWDLVFQHRHIFRGRLQPLQVTDLFDNDPDAMRRGHYSRVYSWMLYTNLAGFHATGSGVMDEFARWQIRRILSLLRHRHGQLTSWRNRSIGIGESPQDSGVDSLLGYISRFAEDESVDVPLSTAKTWMEAQGVLALHEAYKTYDDERILDGIWALADYFSHHVVFYPRLGMVNQHTSMPNAYLGAGENSMSPQRHDRHIQAWPVLYHYTGWPDVRLRYDSFEEKRENTYVRDWFLQTLSWETDTRKKLSEQAPARVNDLRAVNVGRKGIELKWTSPADDGPDGHAERYFVKISDRPLVEYAPTDNPMRVMEKKRVVMEAEDTILQDIAGRKRAKSSYSFEQGAVRPESTQHPRLHPDWHKVNAFWMAEHVAGEPVPGPAGSEETFTLTTLLPHNWFGLEGGQGLGDLKPGKYYIAIAAWDSDRNLSSMSNVVEVDLGRLH